MILDFATTDADKILIVRSGFGIAAAVAMDTGNANDFALHYFVSGAAAAGLAPNSTEALHGQFLFNTTTNTLYWDSNGTTSGGLNLIATLNTALNASDFELR